MNERSTIALLAAEANVADDVQGAENRGEHTLGDKCLAEQIANHKVNLQVKQYFADFQQRSVGKVNQRIFKKFQIAHAD